MSDSEEGGALRLLLPFGDSDDEPECGAPAQLPPPPPSEFAFTPGGGAGPPLRVRTHAARGIGFQLWPAAHAAVAYAEARHAAQPGCWRGVRVLELGAGCGLTGLAFAALGAHVVLTDLDDVAQGILAENVAANAAAVAAGGGAASAAALRWGDAAAASALTPPHHPPWDLLLAADCVYRRELFAPLRATLRALAAPGHTRLVLAHLKRWSSERLFWRELAREWGPRSELLSVPQPADPANGQARPVRVFECAPPRDERAAPAQTQHAQCADVPPPAVV